MNIFEALEAGNDKACRLGWPYRPGRDGYVSRSDIDSIKMQSLKCNDWIPYVSPEEKKIEGMLKFTDPWGAYYYTINEWRKMGYRDDYIEKFVIKPNVPRETSCVCKNIQSGERVEVDFNQKCIKCGKQFNFVLAKTKTKHKEVFENVVWKWNETVNIVFPYFDINPSEFEKLTRKNTKVTVEWEE